MQKSKIKIQNNNLKFKIKKIFYFFTFLFIIHYYLLFINSVLAVCPLCTVAVGAGVGLCRYLGIDDTISGVWIGGLVVSLGFWLADFLRKKKINFIFLEFWSTLLMFLLTAPFLYWAKLIGIPHNTLWGIDKLVLGMVSGAVAFVLSVFTDKFLRKINQGKMYIYYQKVLLPLLYLTILSLVFYRLSC
jgi:hypothetical protein